MIQGQTEMNDEYLDRLNAQLQNLILAVVKHILCSLKTMCKAGLTDTPEEVTIKEETFKAIMVMIWSDEYRYG